jgi:hypothetical protein
MEVTGRLKITVDLFPGKFLSPRSPPPTSRYVLKKSPNGPLTGLNALKKRNFLARPGN